MSRISVVAVVAVVLLATVPSAPASADGFVSVSTTVTPDQPTVEEEFRISAAISNGPDSDTTYRISKLRVTEQRDGDSEELASRELSNRVSPDETAQEGIDVTLNETGEQTVYLQIRLLDDTGDRRTVVQPVTVDVRDPHPQIGISTESAAPGEARPLTVTLSNGLDSRLSNVELQIGSQNLSIRNDRRVVAGIGPESDQTFEFSVTPTGEQRQPVTVSVEYSLDGERRTLERTVQTDFSPRNGSSERPQLQLGVQEAVPGAQRLVNVTVANGLTDDVRQLQVLVSAGNETVSFSATERVQASLAAGGTTTFRFPATVAQSGQYPVTVTLVYTDEGTRKRVSKTFTGDFTGPSSPGTVELTNVQAVVSGGSLRVDATAGNPGTTTVGGVTVAIGEAEGVGSSNFFLGEIVASDGFQSFTLTAPVTGNVSSVPIEVSYVIDGVRTSYTTEIDVAQPQTPAQRPSDGSSGGGILLPAVGLGVLLVVILLIVRRVR